MAPKIYAKEVLINGDGGPTYETLTEADVTKLHGIPATGVSGYSGHSGYSGQKGDTGATGASGTSGYSGQRGISGYSGAAGPQGPQGTSGYSGATGPQGPVGSGGGITKRAVNDITAPSAAELGNGTAEGELILAYDINSPNTADTHTLYAWDVSAPAANGPFCVPATGGSWIAVAGHYGGTGVRLSNGLLFGYGQMAVYGGSGVYDFKTSANNTTAKFSFVNVGTGTAAVWVGVNKTNPSAALDVNGSGVVSGGLNVGSATGAADGQIKTSGGLSVAGEIDGYVVSWMGHYSSSFTVSNSTQFLVKASVPMSAGRGHVARKPGSIVGVTGNYDLTSASVYASTSSYGWIIYKNGSIWISPGSGLSTSVADNKTFYTTFARGTYAFAAGDIISFGYLETGTSGSGSYTLRNADLVLDSVYDD